MYARMYARTCNHLTLGLAKLMIRLVLAARLLGCRLRGSNLGPPGTAPPLEVAVKSCSSSARDIDSKLEEGSGLMPAHTKYFYSISPKCFTRSLLLT